MAAPQTLVELRSVLIPVPTPLPDPPPPQAPAPPGQPPAPPGVSPSPSPSPAPSPSEQGTICYPVYDAGVREVSKNGVDEKTAGDIFDLMAYFAGYGFNKSHSAAYGLITYQTAYLKHHYPTAFMAALMTCDKNNNDNVVKFIAEARSMGITVEA